jgi:hypothetical protein
MNAYLVQGHHALRESLSAIVVAEKDKKVRLYGVPEAVGLSWGIWEMPDADNDDEWFDSPTAA